MSYNFNTMKVAQLRKLVSENNIFSGGLSSMKKKDLIDKIYESEWYHLNHRPSSELTEKEDLERKLFLLQQKLSEIQKPEEPVEEVVEEPVVEEVIPEPVEEVVEEVEEPVKQEVEDLNDRIQQAVQEALLKQKESFMSKLFG